MILQRKADYDAAIKAATTARSVADSLELYAEELLDAIPDSVYRFKEDFDKVCEAAIWTTDFEDDYDPDEQFESMSAEIQYAGIRAHSNSPAEEKIARISCYVRMLTYWLSETTGVQPGPDDREQARVDSHYELQLASVDEDS